YEVTLTYLSWGFDWQANYVATLLPEQEQRKRRGDEFEMNWLSWLTLVNDNGQSFDNAQLQIIAGRLNIQSDFQGLSDPPVASPLRLTCYPIGSTKTGSPVPRYDPVPPPPPPPPPAYSPQAITVTGSRLKRSEMADLAVAVSAVETASEENLGDLKLYRVPRRVDVSAQAMKQVAFLNKDEVKVRYLYLAYCDAYDWIGDTQTPLNTEVLLVTKNEDKKGLGIALPQGAMKLFEPTSRGSRLAATADLRDYGRGQDIELNLGESAQVFSQCGRTVDEDFDDESRKWVKMITRLTNANPDPVKVRVDLGWPSEYDVRVRGRKVRVKNGSQVVEVSVPGNDTLEFRWKLRSAIAD
ncbi:MAG: hypothetical protein SXU28_06840, partial [Pseudomonadota bacterium]|nr:hypothetical protein [Pseudomonadota bacterium]